jgi:hypothetical protein
MASQEPESTTPESAPQGTGRDGQRKKYIYALSIAIIALFVIIYLVV